MLEDSKIREYLNARLAKASVSRIVIERTIKRVTITVCTSRPGMIIGKGGQMLKKIASAARMDIEELLGVKVNLQCWVKVREDWRDNELQLNSLGFAKP